MCDPNKFKGEQRTEFNSDVILQERVVSHVFWSLTHLVFISLKPQVFNFWPTGQIWPSEPLYLAPTPSLAPTCYPAKVHTAPTPWAWALHCCQAQLHTPAQLQPCSHPHPLPIGSKTPGKPAAAAPPGAGWAMPFCP